MSDAGPPATPPSETSRPSDSPVPPWGRAGWAGPVLAALLYLLFWQVVLFRWLPDSLIAVLVSTVISLALVVWFPAQFARTFRHPRALALNALCAAALVMPLQVSVFIGRPLAPWNYLVLVPGLPSLLLIWLAASLGALLSFVLRGANMIPPVAVVLALVDIWTVLLGGPVQKIMQSQNPAAQRFSRAISARLPTPPLEKRGAAPLHVDVGFADFLFIAFFVAAICRFAPGPGTYVRTLWGLIAVLCAYMLVVLVKEINLPALVPMAILMIGLHWRRFHYERSELFALLYAALFIGLIAAGFWLFGRAKEPAVPSDREPGVEQTGSISPVLT
jgi:hypothetical protein